MKLPESASIFEVGPRDGFQSEKDWISTDDKIALIDALSETGIDEIQVTSFVHPKAIPQLADAETVVAEIKYNPEIIYRALVPNMKGLERALHFKDKIKGINVMLSVTQSHNKANGNSSISDTLLEIERMSVLAKQERIHVWGSMICAFGCPFEGRVSIETLDDIVDRYYQIGVNAISLADTIGSANPKLIYKAVSHLRKKYKDITFSLHLHNTRGMALANALAGLQAGIARLDGGIGGLGGCPYAPGATGNIATEDLVNMLEHMGVRTRVDMEKLLNASQIQRTFLPHAFNSAVQKAGPYPSSFQKAYNH